VKLPAIATGFINDTNFDGVFDATDPTAAAVGVSGTIQRGAVEFDLTSIPGNATINSATFSGTADVASGRGIITIIFGVYAGNGTIDVADATAAAGIAGSLSIDISTIIANPDRTCPINPLAVQDLIGSQRFLGLVLSRDRSSEGTSFGFASINNPNPVPKPALTIEYTVPEPHTCWLGCLLAMRVLQRRRQVC
jgi:hypothetical protein